VAVDLDKRLLAAVAQHHRVFLITRAFCRRVMSFPGRRFTASLYAVCVCGLRSGEVAHQSYQLVDVAIPVIPKLDFEWLFYQFASAVSTFDAQ
jgi:hypothetical protein